MRQDKAKSHYDPTGRDLPPLEGGSKVRIRSNGEKHWKKAEVMLRSYVHRRTGNFLPGGAVSPKILASCPNFHEAVEKKRGSYDALTKAYI